MYFERIYEPVVAQASYLVGCQATGEALVVDPTRDVARYVDAAASAGLRITHVAETHIHADFVSGARELAQLTGATLLLSGEGGADWQYAYAHDAGAILLRDGDAFMVGNVRIGVLHTPGHTPEHLAYTVTDTPRGPQPLGVITGDFVFVGDVGRPDLLERAAGHAGTMEDSARTLFRSLARFKQLSDYLQLWPGHGAGSACGKALGAVPQTTLGYERLFNWAFAIDDEHAFVAAVLEGQPEPPAYFAIMKRVNRDGPALLGERATPAELAGESLGTAVRDGFVVDTRDASRFAAGHVPGTVNVPASAKLATWVASLLSDQRDVYLIVAERDGRVDEMVRALALVGVDHVRGTFDPAALAEWAASHGPLAVLPQAPLVDLADGAARDDVLVVDVRNPSEWGAGHVPGVVNVPLGGLAHDVERVRALAGGRPIAVHCQGGTRSVIAASVLRAHGMDDVTNLTGGFAAWEAAGLAVERGAPNATDSLGAPTH
jgi:hydroxyacylglutathione hydrolase